MQRGSSNNTPTGFKGYSQKGLELGAYKGLSVFATQPLQRVLREQQASLIDGAPKTAWQVARSIVMNNHSPRSWQHITPFFRGTKSAIVKEVAKSTLYKGAALKGGPELAKKLGNNTGLNSLSLFTQHILISSTGAAIAASVDVAIGGPLDGYATHAILRKNKEAGSSFWQELKSCNCKAAMIKHIYRGGAPAWAKTFISCLALFSSSGTIRAQVYRQHQLSVGDTIPAHVSLKAAGLTGGAVAVVSSIPDILKTLRQMPGANPNQSLHELLSNNIARYGLRGATAGLPFKFVLTCIGWGIAAGVTDRQEHVEAITLHRFEPK